MGLMTMTRDEREAFLAEARVGVLAVASGGAPLLTPVWYSYEPGGEVLIVTGGDTPKVALMHEAGSASLCVQTETAPYKYVVVEGTVTIDGDVDDKLRSDMAHHYLGVEQGDMYLQATAESVATSVTVRLQPERWRTTDFAKQWG
jgi:PPOX class probable F420-dependent enzyme